MQPQLEQYLDSETNLYNLYQIAVDFDGREPLDASFLVFFGHDIEGKDAIEDEALSQEIAPEYIFAARHNRAVAATKHADLMAKGEAARQRILSDPNGGDTDDWWTCVRAGLAHVEKHSDDPESNAITRVTFFWQDPTSNGLYDDQAGIEENPPGQR